MIPFTWHYPRKTVKPLINSFCIDHVLKYFQHFGLNLKCIKCYKMISLRYKYYQTYLTCSYFFKCGYSPFFNSWKFTIMWLVFMTHIAFLLNRVGVRQWLRRVILSEIILIAGIYRVPSSKYSPVLAHFISQRAPWSGHYALAFPF